MLSILILLKPCEIKFLFVCILQERKLMLILQKRKLMHRVTELVISETIIKCRFVKASCFFQMMITLIHIKGTICRLSDMTNLYIVLSMTETLIEVNYVY